jgi:hypothetical protein
MTNSTRNTEQIDISKVSRFLEQFDAIRETPDIDTLSEIRELFHNAAPIIEQEELLDISQARNFNIFRLLSLERDEVNLHTPFIANLLNVKGNHQQKDLFFRKFIQSLPADFKPSNSITQANIWTEYVTELGRIDILISCKSGDTPFYIVVENKIDAGDQLNQLERYYTYLKDTLGLQDKQILILYLTPKGSQPNIPLSISKDIYQKLTYGHVFGEIGYYPFVDNWLRQSITLGLPPRLELTIYQYLQIANSL